MSVESSGDSPDPWNSQRIQKNRPSLADIEACISEQLQEETIHVQPESELLVGSVVLYIILDAGKQSF